VIRLGAAAIDTRTLGSECIHCKCKPKIRAGGAKLQPRYRSIEGSTPTYRPTLLGRPMLALNDRIKIWPMQAR
jgi:hypothetical protein